MMMRDIADYPRDRQKRRDTGVSNTVLSCLEPRYTRSKRYLQENIGKESKAIGKNKDIISAIES